MDWQLTEKRKANILKAIEALKKELENDTATYVSVSDAIDEIEYHNDSNQQ